jgi:hypothetical protein
LRREAERASSFEGIVGASPGLAAILAKVSKVAVLTRPSLSRARPAPGRNCLRARCTGSPYERHKRSSL